MSLDQPSFNRSQFATRPSRLRSLLRSPLLHPLNDADAINDWLAQANPLWSINQLKARVVAVIDETADTKTFIMQPNLHWNSFSAGQHVQVEVEIKGVRCQRTYSLSSATGSRQISITVKRQPQGKVSNWLHDHIAVGDVLRLGAVTGDFTLPQNAPGKLLMLSAGSGITPVMSMLRTLHQSGYQGDIVFLHSCRTADDAIFGGELQVLGASMPGLRLHTHYTAESGRISPQTIADVVPDYAQRLTLLCGPDGFMDMVRGYWKQQNLEASLLSEHFTNAFLRREPGEAVQAQIACTRSERMFDSQGAAPLLEEAEAAGLQPKYGCRIGICHTCKCKKVSGTVENLLTGQISSEPNEMIQLCVSAARSNVTLDI